jgi:sugar transferase (PEP-CTERM system associated)
VADACAFAASFYVALVMRFGAEAFSAKELTPSYQLHSILFSACLLGSFMAFGLYSGRLRARVLELSLRIIAASVTGTAVIATLLYLVPTFFIGRGVLAFSIALAICSSILIRLVFQRVVDEGVLKRRVVVYGAGKRAAPFTLLRRRADRRGFNLVGFLPALGEECLVEQTSVLRQPDDWVGFCHRLRIDEIVLAMDDRRRAFPTEQLLACRLAGIDVTELPAFLERETSRLRLDLINPSWLILGPGFRRNVLRLVSSRVLDLLASVALLFIFLPAILLAMVAIKFEDGWRASVLYRQPRIGLHGRIFNLLKFRSMRSDAESDGLERWAEKHDKRVTRVGAIMRRSRIDELPQLLNVLSGQMSIVGPRPERPRFVKELTQKIPYYGQRHSVRPGITGWAQICYPYGASENDALQKLQYDLYYIKNNNLIFDLSILVQTLEVVCFGKGAR